MAAIVNARDVKLQAAPTRLANVSMASNLVVDQSQVTGLGLVVEGTKLVFLSATAQVFQIAKTGTVSPASTTLTATVRNLSTAPTLTVISGTITPAPVLSGGTVTIANTALQTDTATLRLTVVENSVTYSDEITIVKVREGDDALNGFLTNESHTITADYLGNPLSYSGASGTFKVYRGTTDITSLCTFSLVSNPSALTYTLGATTGTYSVTGGYPTGTDLTTITFRATFGTATIDKVFSIAKAKAATPSKTLTMTASSQVFQIAKSGTVSPASITFTPKQNNLSGTPTFTASPAVTLTTSNGVATLTYANMGSNDAVTVTVSQDGMEDKITVVKVREGVDGTDGVAGEDAIVSVLSNESHTVPADNSGGNVNYAGASTGFTIYEGITNVSDLWAYSTVATNCTVTPTSIAVGATAKTFTVSAMTADVAYVDITATRSGYPTQTKRFTVTKAKQGANGANPVVGYLTNEAVTIPTANDGSGGLYTGAGGTFKVFDGLTDKTGSGPVYSIGVAATAGLTATINAGTGVYTASLNTATDSGTVTFRAVYNGVTIDKVYTISKSKAGVIGSDGADGAPGADAKLLTLSSTAQAFTYGTTGSLSPASQTISFTAKLQNIAGTATFTAIPYNSSNVAGAAITMGGTGNTRTLTGAQFAANAYVVVTASLSGLSDQITVVRLADGAKGADGTNGTNGTDGKRGSRTFYVALSGSTSTYSTTLATTTASVEGGPILNDTVVQYNNSVNFAETRFWNGSSWVVVNAVVDGNLLVNGTVGTQHLSANSVTTEKMLITGSNLIANSDFSTGTLANWRPWNSPALQSVMNRTNTGIPTTCPTYWMCRIFGDGTTKSSSLFASAKAYTDPGAESDGFVVRDGEQFMTKIYAAANSTFINDGSVIALYAYFLRKDGTLTSFTIKNLNNYGLSATWQSFDTYFIVPANCIRCWLYVNVINVVNGAVYFTGLSCNKKADADLIVDGSIVADKLATDSVTTNKIAAGAVTASKITTTGLEILDANGNVILKSGTTPGYSVMNTGPNLFRNSMFLHDVNNSTSPIGWSRAINGAGVGNAQVLKPANAVSYAPPWDPRAPLLYSRMTDATSYVRWVTDEYIGVDSTRTYNLSAWFKEYTGTSRVYLGLYCYDSSYTLIDYVYIYGGSFRVFTTWTRFDGNYGPGGTAWPAGTAYVRLLHYGQYNQIGATMATRFALVEGSSPPQNYVPFDANVISDYNPIDSTNAPSLIVNGAISADKLNVTSLSAITANIGTLRTATTGSRLEISDNVIKVYDGSTLRVQIGNLSL